MAPLVRFPVLVAAALAVAELLLRVPAVASWLPDPTIYYDTAVAKRLGALDTLVQSRGRVDVLFVGSSVVRTNISPLDFDSEIGRRSGLDVVSFNGGLSGLWPAGVELYLRDLWLQRVHPRVVVQAIRYTELRATTFSVNTDLLNGIAESHWHRGTRVDRMEWAAIDSLRLLQFRGAMGRWLRGYVNGRRGDDNELARWEIDSRGFTARGPALEVLLKRGLLRDEKPYSGTFAPATCAFGFDALRRASDAARAIGATYVLVNMPEHAFRWSAPDGAANYRIYLAALGEFARQTGVELIDLTGGDPLVFHDDREFADFHHMTPAGARRVTSLLADRLAISHVLLDAGLARLATHPVEAPAQRQTMLGADDALHRRESASARPTATADATTR